MDTPRRIKAKPLSVNRCWQGKRFKTKEYKDYEQQIRAILPDDVEVPEGKLSLKITWGLSSRLSDWDNPVKPFQDIIQKHYGFDDRYVYVAHVNKVDVKRGEEFIEFQIKEYTEEDVMISLTNGEARFLEEVLEDMQLLIENGEDFVDDVGERVTQALDMIHACNVYDESKMLEETPSE